MYLPQRHRNPEKIWNMFTENLWNANRSKLPFWTISINITVKEINQTQEMRLPKFIQFCLPFFVLIWNYVMSSKNKRWYTSVCKEPRCVVHLAKFPHPGQSVMVPLVCKSAYYSTEELMSWQNNIHCFKFSFVFTNYNKPHYLYFSTGLPHAQL